jgi:DUF917 family protein
MQITKDMIRPAVYGGVFYGGGGGGSIEDGLYFASVAFEYGIPQLTDIEDMRPDDLLATCSMVGAPAAEHKKLSPEDFIKSVQLLQRYIGQKLAGFISNENGAVGTINGWLQSAYYGLPVVDAPANGRAHPTGVMGAMGLNQLSDYLSHQAAVGGDVSHGKHLELYINGTIDNTSVAVRHAAELAGGMVAVCRNPVCAEYVAQNGARGAIKQAIAVGRVIEAQIEASAEIAAQEIAAVAGGQIVDFGQIKEKELRTIGGFDIGHLIVEAQDITYRIAVWNEYLSLEVSGKILGAFPDLLVLFDCKTNLPITSACAEIGQNIAILQIPGTELKLGKGIMIPENLTMVNRIIRKEYGN